ncbi:MAG TPA: carboxypeptidase-like regulatory domain-containing protein [Candidatus Sulfotelmatobacter sp.]|nr:carboxypeptidase-like regulatory domain-containing protein [Candidatus Sulfotelmatobacter sp.]
MAELLLLLVICLGLAVSVQAQTGTITGTVVDAQGAVIAGASVKAVDQAKGIVVREATSTADGLFVLEPLLPGTYTVRLSAKGMKDLERPNLFLDQNQVLGLGNMAMAVGAATESITVEATTPLVETATADHSAVIDPRQVLEISMNGRGFEGILRTLPGVLSNDVSDFAVNSMKDTSTFHVNGMRGSNNNTFLDGAINTDMGDNGSQYTQISMDAVQEFKLQTNNFAAEYGRNPGVMVAMNTKSGGQHFHGTLYEFNRENGFDAAPYFNKVQPNGMPFTTATPEAKLRFNQYGGNIGGPIPLWKASPYHAPKMFFFFNYEGTNLLNPGTSTYNMPNPAMLGIGVPAGVVADLSSALSTTPISTWNSSCPYQSAAPMTGQIFVPGTMQFNSAGNITCGNPIAGNIITSSMTTSSQLAAWKNFITPWYKPGGFVDPNVLGNWIVPYQTTSTFTKRQEVVRYDWNINAKTNFFFRWVNDNPERQSYPSGIGWGGPDTFPGVPNFRQKPGANWSWNLVNSISPTMTNEFIFAYLHLTQLVDLSGSQAASDKTALGFTFGDLFPGANLRNLVPGIRANSLDLNMQYFNPGWLSEGRTFTWTDNLTKVVGTHTIKTGVFFDYNQNGQQPSWTESPLFDFQTGGRPSYLMDSGNGIANMIFGNYYTAAQSNGDFFGAFRFHQLELYGQDTWKATRKLTLDYGLRWGYLGPMYTVKPYYEWYFDPARYNPADAVTIDTRATNIPAGIINGAICTATMANPCPGVTNFGNPYNGMVREGTNGIPPGFVDHRYGNLEPRVGFAYDVFGNGKTAIRGGFGMFHERIRANVNSFDGLGNPPLLYTPTIYNGNIDQFGSGLVSGGALTTSTVRTQAKDGHIPTTYSWSIGIQQELPWKMVVDAAYVGNQARHVIFVTDLNQFPLGTTTAAVAPACAGGTSTWLNCANYKGYSQIFYTQYGGNESYNALQVRVTRRFSKTLTLSADYTYSKNRALTDADDNLPALRDAYNPKLDYGPTGWDRTNVFNLNYVYEFPTLQNKNAFVRFIAGGWETSGIYRAWSGSPFSMLCGGNSGASGGGAGSTAATYCDYTPGVPVYIEKGLQWANPYAFTQPLNGAIGNTTRNEFRGPGYQNWNLSLFKNFNFKENMRLQLRLETFNTFNTSQFGGSGSTSGGNTTGGVNQTITTAGPGLGTTASLAGLSGYLNSARDQRMIQLGAKFYF